MIISQRSVSLGLTFQLIAKFVAKEAARGVIDKRPSFKVKKMEASDGGPYVFGEGWVSEKATLHNGVESDIVDAEVRA